MKLDISYSDINLETDLILTNNSCWLCVLVLLLLLVGPSIIETRTTIPLVVQVRGFFVYILNCPY